MRATQWEFRYRFLIITLLYWAAFGLYRFDRVNSGGGREHRHDSQSLGLS